MKLTLRTILYSAALLFSATIAFSQPLTGIKTIGGTGPDYANLADAVNAVNTNGVAAGGVTFNLRDGVYTGNVTITVLASMDNPVIFQSENLDASLVTISSSAAADVITLTGATYITFNELTIDYAGSAGYNAIEIKDNAHDLLIDNCVVDGTTAATTTYASSALYANETSAASDCRNITVRNSVIRGGAYGICIGMSSSQPGGIVVEDNELENSYAGAIYLRDLDAVVISGNSIHNSNAANSGAYGMNIDNCDGQNIIRNNYIYVESGGRYEYGIYFTGSSSAQGTEALIFNNSIQVENGTSICYGIYQSNNSNYWGIYNNTVYISGGTSTTTACYNGYTASNDTKITNNIFVNAATATSVSSNRTVYIANTSGISEIGYNCYWTANTGNPFRAQYGTAYTSFSAFTTATGETGSLNIDPQMTFVSGTGWKASNMALIGTGQNLPGITDDVDKTPRVTPTSIGAHELDQTTSITETNPVSINVYEWNRTLFIASKNSGTKAAELVLMDISGNKILSQNIDLSQTNQVDISTVATGIYFVSIYEQNAVFTTKLFVK